MNTLSTTPLHAWPGEALMREAKRVATFWSNDPAFRERYGQMRAGGLYVDKEERAAEIMARVLARLKKEPPKPHLDQMTFFHQVARYCKPGIAHENKGRMSVTEGAGGDGDANNDEIADLFFSVGGGSENEEQHTKATHALFKKIGVSEKDITLFDATDEDWMESTGLSKRLRWTKKDKRRKEIIAKIKEKGLCSEAARLMPRLRDTLFSEA